MENQNNRSNAAIAQLVDQGIEWRDTYGTRSAAAFLAIREVPRPIIQRVLASGNLRPVAARKRADR
jgi:uncharacterized protein with GYD domain